MTLMYCQSDWCWLTGLMTWTGERSIKNVEVKSVSFSENKQKQQSPENIGADLLKA